MQSRRRRAAFTLVEMIVVTMIIALMAALIMPNVVAFKRSRDLKDTQAKILRLPLEAKNEAMRSGRPVQLHFDGEDLVMTREPAPGMSNATSNSSQGASLTVGATASTGGSGTTVGAAGTTDEESDTEQDVKRVPLGSSISTAGNIDISATSAVTVPVSSPAAAISSSGSTGTAGGGSTTDVASWKWTAYPDGTQDGGGITFRVGDGEMSLLIPSDGSAPRWVQGSMPPLEDEKWPAGDLLRRSS